MYSCSTDLDTDFCSIELDEFDNCKCRGVDFDELGFPGPGKSSERYWGRPVRGVKI